MKQQMQEFIDSHFELYIAGVLSGDPLHKWEPLRARAYEAQEALTDGNAHKIALAFYLLGKVAERLNHPSPEEMAELYAAKVKKMESELPLKIRNHAQALLKDMAQKEAADIWARDSGQEYKLKEVAEMVRRHMAQKLEHERPEVRDRFKELPKDLKPWLREVAPEYARKGGRPKKV